MRRTFLILATALLLAQPLSAQMQTDAPAQGTTVTLVCITGIVNPTPEGDPPLPFAVLARLEGDPFLRHMVTEPRVQTGPTLNLTFVFPNVEAYRTWSESAATRQLLGELRQRVSQLSLTVSLRRDPHPFGATAGG
jgi:hypothetical protein